MKPVAQLVIEMAANLARLQKDMDAAKRMVGSAMNDIKNKADMAMRALGLLGTGLSTAAFAGFIKSAIDLNDTLNDLNKSTNLSVQTLAGLNLAAKQSGSDLAGVAGIINKLQMNIGKNADQFKLVGITAKDGLEAFKQLSDVYKEIEDPQLRAAFAAEALGKNWQAAAPLLAAGSEKIQEMVDKGNALTKTNQAIVDASDDFNDRLAELSTSFTGIANQLIDKILPRLTDLLELFIQIVEESTFVQKAISGINIVFETIAVLGANVGFVIKTMWNELVMLGDIAVAIAKLDFQNVGEIWNNSKVAAQQSRAALDAWTESFMKGQTATERATEKGDGFDKVLKMVNQSLTKGVKAFIDYSEKGTKVKDLYAEMIKKADELVASLQFETKTLEMDNQERETAIQLRKLETIGIQEGTAEYEKYAQAIMDTVAINESIKRRIELEKEAQKERIKQEEDYAKQVEKINDQIGQSLTDALMNGGMNAKEFLINMFKTMVLRPVLQPIITGMVGAMGTGMAGAALANTGGTGTISNAMSMFSIGSALKSAYNFVTTGFAEVGAVASDLALTLMGTETSVNAAAIAGLAGAPVEAGAVAMYEAAASIGTAATALAGAAAGFAAGEFISGGKSLIGGSSMWTTGGGTAIGAAIGSIVPGIGTAIGAAVGGIVGGIVNAAFGSGAKEYTDSGISGTLKAMGADLQEYQKWKKSGGWFSSTKRGTEFNDINAELKQGLDQALGNVALGVAYLAGSLKQPIDAISSYSRQINISFKDLSEAEITAAIEGEIKAFETGLIEAVIPTIRQFSYANEDVSTTLKRLVDGLSTVNSVFTTLGFNLKEISLDGAQAANNIVELVGGVEAFIQVTNYYYENFYSAQEKINNQTKALTNVFDALGMRMPDTNAEFRQFLEAAQAAGNDVLVANLLKLAPAFNELTVAIAQANQAVLQEQAQLLSQIYQATGNTAAIRQTELNATDASNRALLKHVFAMQDAAEAQQLANQRVADATAALNEAVSAESERIKEVIETQLQASLNTLAEQLDAVTQNINSQIEALQLQKQVAQESLSNIKNIFNLLGDNIREILGLMQPTSSAAQGMAFVRQALIVARTTGYLPDAEDLRNAIGAARGGLGAESFGSAFEMRRANIQFANELIQLQEIASRQEESTQQQVDAADEQIELLRRRLEQAKQQYDDQVVNTRNFYNAQLTSQQQQLSALLGINSGVLSLSSAMQGMAMALDAQSAANAALAQAQQQAAFAANQATAVPQMTPFEQGVNQIYQQLLGRSVDVAGLQYWKGTGQSLASIEADIKRGSEYRRIEIQKMYREILGREADASGLAYWMNDPSTLSQIRQNLMIIKSTGKYAEGGFYPGGMALVGEEGPELINFKRPGQVYTASETSEMMAGGVETSSEIRQLREETRAQSRAMVALQARMTRLLERWDGDGLPEERVVTA